MTSNFGQQDITSQVPARSLAQDQRPPMAAGQDVYNQPTQAQIPPQPQLQPHSQVYDPAAYVETSGLPTAPPPQRQTQTYDDDDVSSPVHYTRDPQRLTAYLVPFPKPHVQGLDPARIPDRYLIYTPPAPPLRKPQEGVKEDRLHMVQRKWQEEVKSAKTSTAKTMSWHGVKSKATKGIDWAMNKTTSSNLDFLGRVSDTGKPRDGETDAHAEDGVQEDATTKKTVGVQEMVLVYPPTMGLSQEQIKEEFVNTMLRTKTKAQRDAIISTGLLPVAFGIDILATVVWPFGGLAEIDSVWAYSNVRGAKTARSVTKRLSSSSNTGDHEQDNLHLNFIPSPRIEVLRKYLDAMCNRTDSQLFSQYVSAPTETDVLEAIGWAPVQSGVEEENWEDEQWQTTEVKKDLKTLMTKGSKEWVKWLKVYARDPEKAMSK